MRRSLGALSLLALGLASGCGTRRVDMSSGSYVQDVTTQSAIVAAVSESPTKLRLLWGPAGAPPQQTLTEEAAVQVHGIRAEGLEPGTLYGYRLEALSGQVVGEGSFRSAPDASDAPCRVLVLGDSGGTDADEGELVNEGRALLEQAQGSGGDEKRQAEVVAAMLGRPRPDLVLHLGDVVYPSGARRDYPEGYFRPFAPLIKDVPVYPTLGNHDTKTEGGAPFLETFFTPAGGPDGEGRIYSFDWGTAHFVCLDDVSTAFEAGSAQARWLSADLRASRAPWKIVYFHVPPFSPEGGAVPVRDELVPLLEEGGADLVLCGHSHTYGRFKPRGKTLYVVSGGGGKNLRKITGDDALAMDYSESVFHFLELEISPDRLQLRAVDATGNVFDEAHLLK